MKQPEEQEGALLLQEIRALAREVGNLRTDTQHLNDVVVPRAEIRLRRRLLMVVCALGFVLLALPLALLYVAERRDDADDRRFQEQVLEFERATIEACQIRNRALENDRRFAQALIVAFSQDPDGSSKPFLEIVKAYDEGLGELVDCSKRERLLR